MFFRLSVIVVATLLAPQAWSLWYIPCKSGFYDPGDHNCQPCPDGTYNNQIDAHGCTACPAGTGPNALRDNCTPCDAGKYSIGGTSCMNCPAGQTNTADRTACQKCDPGEFSPTLGGTCEKCPAGTFNSFSGATSCCTCCNGWYSDSSGSTSCKRCCDLDFNPRRRYSLVGSGSANDCLAIKATLPEPTTTCDMAADNACPNPTGDGPQGTPVTRKKRDIGCPEGFAACPRYSGQGGFECVNTENDPESCGGCVGLDVQGTGTDCTAIKGVSVTRCVKGSCVIDSCRKGWTKSLDSIACVLASRKMSHPEQNGLYTRDTNAKKTRSSAKRTFRANIY